MRACLTTLGLGLTLACSRAPSATTPRPAPPGEPRATPPPPSAPQTPPVPAAPPTPPSLSGCRAEDRTLFDLAVALGADGELHAMEQAFVDWRQRYGKDAGNEDDWVRSYFLAAEAFASARQFTEATKLYDASIAAWKDTGARRGTPSAALVAEIFFYRAESQRHAFDRVSFPAAPATKQAADVAFDNLDQLRKAAQTAYESVKQYDAATWNVAADVRIGDLYFCQAEKLASIPMPTNLVGSSPNVNAQYRAAIHNLGEPLRDLGRKLWRQAAALAEREAVPNPWGDRARARADGTRLPGC